MLKRIATSKIPQCHTCTHYKPLEDLLGECHIFGNIYNAREHRGLCGPDGKYFAIAIKKNEYNETNQNNEDGETGPENHL